MNMLNSIAEIIIAGMIASWLCRLIRIPDLIGFLLIGLLFGPYVLQILDPSFTALSGELRTAALIVILLRAGFELRKDTLKKVGRPVLLLALFPPLFETLAAATICVYAAGLSWNEGLMLGIILSAVSPAAVVPLMIRFRNEKRGINKEIPTMVLAASSLNNILVLIVFSILVVFLVRDEMLTASAITSVPISIATGITIGIVSALLLIKIFDRFNPRATRRVLLILAVAVVFLRLEKEFAQWVPFAALLAVMTLGYILLNKREKYAHEISQKLAKIWILAEMILFTLVGAEVNPEIAIKIGLTGLLIIGGGLLVRSLVTWLCLTGTNLNKREKGFVVISYIPKATVQAAIGAVPLALTHTAGAEIILAVAVLSIVVTAPLGAIAIEITGKKWLEKA
jgi:NhaP-type Na+/H+ or K+/H+ antiporter